MSAKLQEESKNAKVLDKSTDHAGGLSNKDEKLDQLKAAVKAAIEAEEAALEAEEVEEAEGEEEDAPALVDPVLAAEAAGLYYVMDGEPGFTRQQQGESFIYQDRRGKEITSSRQLTRFKSLVLPPAWTNVWICCRTNGHIQATGRDKKGRKQYRYHPEWNKLRSLTKFGRMAAFGAALPAIRARVKEDLQGQKLIHQKVVALVIRLMEKTLIRVGNQEYARLNNSYGLTTLLDEHITVNGSRLTMEFIGKRGKHFSVDVQDRRLSNLVKRCQDLPGQRLFQYLDEDGACCQAVTSGDVNTYLRDTTGQDFSAKDFRTWGGTVRAAVELYLLGPAASEKENDKRITQVVKTVAETLGNTPAVCRKYYIHPLILETYQDGRLFEVMNTVLQRAEEPSDTSLTLEEQAVLKLLDPAH